MRTTAALLLSWSLFACGCGEEGVEGVAVTYETTDGLTLHATYNEQATGPTPTLILLHQPGPNNSRFDWDPIWGALENRGYALLAPDLRSHGSSDSDGPWEDLSGDPTKYPLDLLSWLSFIADRESSDGLVARSAVGVLGFGESGSLAAAAMGKGHITCAVAISPDLASLAALQAGFDPYDPDEDEARGDDDDSAGDDDDSAGDDDDSAEADPFEELDLHTIRYMASQDDQPSAADAQTMFEHSADPTDLTTFPGTAHGVDMLWLSSDGEVINASRTAMVDWCDGRF